MSTKTIGYSCTAFHEWVSHDAFGRAKSSTAPSQLPITDAAGIVRLWSARSGYASFRIVVRGNGEYRLVVEGGEGLEIDLFRAWYHTVVSDDGTRTFYPDALVPFEAGASFRVPDPDNAIDGQTAQEFWVDVYVAAEVPPGEHEFSIACVGTAGATEKITVPVAVTVTGTTLPDRPGVLIDHNSYGTKWLERLYPVRSDQTGRIVDLLHHHYRLVREHRGIFHNLGTSHSGSVSKLYAPTVSGRGRALELREWETFDTHLGPLLGGEVFAIAPPGVHRARMSPYPIESIYTPFTPSWPAAYEKWGEAGYEVELVRGLRQFDRHVAERGWLDTTYEFFFNHKKRYRWYGWDGDEVKYPKDFAVHDEMYRIFDSAAAGAKGRWRYRFDASWQLEQQFRRYAGRNNFWVCGGMHRWYPEAVGEVVDRGEDIWWYGGLPPLDSPDTAVLALIYETWARKLGGICLWLTVSPDDDPWGVCTGNRTADLYPGTRFGIDGPIPSVRLKIIRNGVQDIDLLPEGDGLREVLASRVPIPLWEERPPAARIMDPSLWDSENLSYEHEPIHRGAPEDPGWWTAIREYSRGVAK